MPLWNLLRRQRRKVVRLSTLGADLYGLTERLLRDEKINGPLVVEVLDIYFSAVPFWLRWKKVKRALIYGFFVGMAYERLMEVR